MHRTRYDEVMDKEKRIQDLTEEERYITQEKGTEAPFHNKYWDHHESGMYVCKVCGAKLFGSDTKFDSGTGWPSYDSPVTAGAVKYIEDTAHGMHRIEAVCAN